jgi:archaetidylserine synthase
LAGRRQERGRRLIRGTDRGSAAPPRGVAAADLLTIGNGLCGLAIIVVASQAASPGRHVSVLDRGTLLACAGLIVVACALDVADGAAAARWGGSGRGEMLDAMCDALTFGLAPGMMLIAAYRGGPTSVRAMSMAAAGILLVASLLRLSRARRQGMTRAGFEGLTMPGGAAGVTALLVLHADAEVALAGTAAIAALLASTVRYPTFGPRSVTMLGAAWVLAVLGVAGALPLWPAACATLACVVGAPLVELAPGSGGSRASFATIVRRDQRPSVVTPARTRSPTRTEGSIAAGITRSTREPKRIIPIRSPWTIRSPTRR